jgi:cell division protein FtsL
MGTFELGASINKMADWVCNSSLMQNTCNNPIMVALILTSIIAIIIIGVFKSKVTNHKKLIVRSMIYILISAIIVIFIHNYAISQRIESRVQNKQITDLFENLSTPKTGAGEENDIVQVEPTSSFTSSSDLVNDVILPTTIKPF